MNIHRIINIKKYIYNFKPLWFYIPGKDAYFNKEIVYAEICQDATQFLITILILLNPIIGVTLGLTLLCNTTYIKNYFNFKAFWLENNIGLKIVTDDPKVTYNMDIFYQPYFCYKPYTGIKTEDEAINEFTHNNYQLITITGIISTLLWLIIILI